MEVLGDTSQVHSTAESIDLDETAKGPRDAETPAAVRAPFKPVEAGGDDESSKEEDTLSYFAKLAKED